MLYPSSPQPKRTKQMIETRNKYQDTKTKLDKMAKKMRKRQLLIQTQHQQEQEKKNKKKVKEYSEKKYNNTLGKPREKHK